jgi:hypothetical protein
MILRWNNRNGWMEFPVLSVCGGLTSTYTLAYRLTDDSQEAWSHRFNRFKANQRPALIGGSRLMYAAVPRLLEGLGLEGKDCVFVAALSSGETVADPDRPIPFIASQCAKIVGATSRIDAVSKQPHKKLHTMYDWGARDAELDKANYACGKLNTKNVFVFDDLVTRGDTLSRVAKSVLASNAGAKVYGVALGKTERVNWCPNPKNDHVPKEWADIWSAGEKE